MVAAGLCELFRLPMPNPKSYNLQGLAHVKSRKSVLELTQQMPLVQDWKTLCARSMGCMALLVARLRW